MARAKRRTVQEFGAHPVDVHVGQRVRMRRVMCGLSQTVLANRIGLTFQQVQKYNNGLNAPHAKTLKHFAKYFDVSMDDLCDPDFIKKRYELVPMTEVEEYKNAGITKEEAKKNGSKNES